MKGLLLASVFLVSLTLKEVSCSNYLDVAKARGTPNSRVLRCHSRFAPGNPEQLACELKSISLMMDLALHLRHYAWQEWSTLRVIVRSFLRDDPSRMH